MGYLPGGAYGICDRCGFKHRVADLRKEWNGLVVCVPDLDPRPSYLDPPNIYPEGMIVPNARPEPDEHELAVGEVTEADL